MPPTSSAQPTTIGLPSSTSMCFFSAKPITAEGRKASRTLRTKAMLGACSRSSPRPTVQNVRQYCTTTARIAPSWMTTLNTFQVSASKPSSSVARIRWPVEETGMNSVRPSTMPRRMAVSVSVIGEAPLAGVGGKSSDHATLLSRSHLESRGSVMYQTRSCETPVYLLGGILRHHVARRCLACLKYGPSAGFC